jgi:hypothetical protein
MAKSREQELPDSKQIPQYANLIKNKKDMLTQYLTEKSFAVKLRQVKVGNWILNEQAYNGVVQKTLMTRSNLHIPIVFEGVQNASAKIGASPTFKFLGTPEGDENAPEMMHHVVKQDLDDSNWDTLYEESKVEAGIYGRTMYEVIPGNDKNRVEVVDSLAYLISPIAKNTRKALYQGRQFIYKTVDELKDEAENMEYDMEELHKLETFKIVSDTQVDASTEASIKSLRQATVGLSNTTQFGSKVAEITSWWTYWKPKGSKKSAVLTNLIVANDMYILRAIPAEKLGLKRPPFISWGTFTRSVSFLSPSVADIYRDPNLAIDVTINQGIDNNTYRNFGMLFVASSSGLKQSSIVPRPLGVTPVQVAPGENIKDKLWQMEVPEIQDAVNMSQVIKGYADSAAGMAPSAPRTKGKVSVTQQAGMQAEIDAKIVVMKRNATLAFQELTQLMADISKEKLTKPRKVKIFGYKNLDVEDVTKKNFDGVIFQSKATPSEDNQQNKTIKQKAKLQLYELFKDDPKVPGQIAMRRSVAKTFDIDPSEVESWFTEDKDQGQAAQPLPSPDAAADPSKPVAPVAPVQQMQTTPAAPINAATQSAAQAQVPQAIK